MTDNAVDSFATNAEFNRRLRKREIVILALVLIIIGLCWFIKGIDFEMHHYIDTIIECARGSQLITDISKDDVLSYVNSEDVGVTYTHAVVTCDKDGNQIGYVVLGTYPSIDSVCAYFLDFRNKDPFVSRLDMYGDDRDVICQDDTVEMMIKRIGFDMLSEDYIFVMRNVCEPFEIRPVSDWLDKDNGVYMIYGGGLYLQSSYCPSIFDRFYDWCDDIVIGEDQDSVCIEKPLLYLYPAQETDVTVTLGSQDDIMVSYPTYDGSWSVKAQPDGILVDSGNRSYNYLYWESDTDSFEPDFSTGFCVKGSDTAAFLEEQLSYMRLSDKEQDDFITYWLPRMQGNPYNLISFQFGNYDEYEGLHISPEPDCLIKVFMAYKPLEEPAEIAPQALPGAERYGFTAVEWGGMEAK